MRQIILDTETTGLDPRYHRIVSLAAIELSDGFLTGRFAHYHLNPERPCDPGAAAIHGLTDEYLAAQPKFREIRGELMDFIAAAELVIHNAQFDIGFLSRELFLAADPSKPFSPIAALPRRFCTLARAEALRGRARGRNNLDALTRAYEVDDIRARTGGKHGAMVDCLQLYGVHRALLNLKPVALLQSTLDHYLTKGFGVHHECFKPASPGSPGVPAQAEADPTDRPPDARPSGNGAGQDVRGNDPVHHAPSPGGHAAVAAESGDHPGSGGNPGVAP